MVRQYLARHDVDNIRRGVRFKVNGSPGLSGNNIIAVIKHQFNVAAVDAGRTGGGPKGRIQAVAEQFEMADFRAFKLSFKGFIGTRLKILLKAFFNIVYGKEIVPSHNLLILANCWA